MTAKLPKPKAWKGNDISVIDLMLSDLDLLSGVTSPEVGI
jgi:hypothetical protein